MDMTSEAATQLSRSGRPHWAIFNVELLAVLAVCVAFWALVALTVYWLI